MTERPKTILITGARAPIVLHLSSLFTAAGWRTVLSDSFKHPIARFAPHCSRYVRLAPPRSKFGEFAGGLNTLIKDEKIDLVLPTSEEIFYVARAAETLHGFSGRVFAPPLEGLRTVHNKWTFSQIAEDFAIKTPNTKLMTTRADLMNAQREGKIFKPVWSRFGDKVLFSPSADKLSKLTISETYPWISQDLIRGTEYCLYAVCRHGKLTALSAYQPTWRAGLGAGIYFLPYQHNDLQKFAQNFAAKTNWHGQVSFDFIRDEHGKFHVLECNPRAVSGLHFFTKEDEFTNAITNATDLIKPSFKTPLCAKIAMKTHALPGALMQGKLKPWRTDMARSTDIFRHGDAAKLGRAQSLFLTEIIGRALRARSSLITASTQDIEWNGEEIK